MRKTQPVAPCRRLLAQRTLRLARGAYTPAKIYLLKLRNHHVFRASGRTHLIHFWLQWRRRQRPNRLPAQLAGTAASGSFAAPATIGGEFLMRFARAQLTAFLADAQKGSTKITSEPRCGISLYRVRDNTQALQVKRPTPTRLSLSLPAARPSTAARAPCCCTPMVRRCLQPRVSSWSRPTTQATPAHCSLTTPVWTPRSKRPI